MSYEKNKRFEKEVLLHTEKEELVVLRQIKNLNVAMLDVLMKIDKKLSDPAALQIEFSTPTEK